MPQITVSISDETWIELERRARDRHRSPEEVAGETIESAVGSHTGERVSLRDLKPFSVGKVLVPYTSRDGLMDEMLDG